MQNSQPFICKGANPNENQPVQIMHVEGPKMLQIQRCLVGFSHVNGQQPFFKFLL